MSEKEQKVRSPPRPTGCGVEAYELPRMRAGVLAEAGECRHYRPDMEAKEAENG